MSSVALQTAGEAGICLVIENFIVSSCGYPDIEINSKLSKWLKINAKTVTNQIHFIAVLCGVVLLVFVKLYFKIGLG